MLPPAVRPGPAIIICSSLPTAVSGQDPNSKLVVINQTQWSGDFLAAGVNAINLWVNNLGSHRPLPAPLCGRRHDTATRQYGYFNQSGVPAGRQRLDCGGIPP